MCDSLPDEVLFKLKQGFGAQLVHGCGDISGSWCATLLVGGSGLNSNRPVMDTLLNLFYDVGEQEYRLDFAL